MPLEFPNDNFMAIDPQRPAKITSPTSVTGVVSPIDSVSVTVDIIHSSTKDLVITLISPVGTRFKLFEKSGGDGENLLGTVFDDRSPSRIANAEAPYHGRFRPKKSLKSLNGKNANGVWALEVEDTTNTDGGALLGWTLDVFNEDSTESEFEIELNFVDGLNASMRGVFEVAKDRWESIILGGENGSPLKLVINAEGAALDGVDGKLGEAGPTALGNSGDLPSEGKMRFDTADLNAMQRNGSLVNVIIHEMGHVLGSGLLWERKGLITSHPVHGPIFTGRNAMEEFGRLRSGPPSPIPVEDRGGPGTADLHWRDRVFENELMTGFVNGGRNPLSRMSVASFEDLGYTVNRDAAEPYTLLSGNIFAGVSTDRSRVRSCMCSHPPLSE